MEQVGVEFFFAGKQAAQGVTDLGKRFFTLDRMQGLAVKGFNTFKTATMKGFTVAQRGVNMFMGGLAKIRSLFDRAKESSKKFGSEASKNLKDSANNITQMGVSAFQIAKGFLIANVAMKGFNALSQSVPAIGQTFDQMGRVISANIVYPLVQEVIPILKSMMDWVSRNRVNFVQIGKVISNLFRVIWQTVKMVVGAIEKLFTSMWETVFGKGTLTFKKFMDYLNLMTLKIAFVVTFLGLMLEPVLEGFATGFKWVFETIVLPILQKVADAIKYIGEVFKDPNKAIKEFDTTAQMLAAGGVVALTFGALLLGEAILASLVPAIISATTAAWAFTVALLANPLTWIILGVMALVGAFVLLYKNWDKITQAFDDGITWIKNWWNSMVTSVSDGITSFVNDIKLLYESIIGWFVGIGTAIKDGIMSGINAAKDYVKNSWVGKVLTKIGVDVGGGAEGGGGPTGGGTPATKFSGNGGTSGGGGSGASYVDNKQIKFEINNPDPKEVANEVERKMKETDKTKKQFQKAARMQGRD